MSCGLPVVAYDCPYGPASIIVDGETGYLVQNDDRMGFVKRLGELMGNDMLRRQMGGKGYKISMKYDVASIMPLWDSLFALFSQKNWNSLLCPQDNRVEDDANDDSCGNCGVPMIEKSISNHIIRQTNCWGVQTDNNKSTNAEVGDIVAFDVIESLTSIKHSEKEKEIDGVEKGNVQHVIS